MIPISLDPLSVALLSAMPVGLIGALIGLGASAIGSFFSSRQSKAAKAATAAQTRLANTNARLSKERGVREKDLFSKSEPIIARLTAGLLRRGQM